MKSNRTHQPPPRVENLGEGTFYYNLDVVKYRPLNQDGVEEDYWAYDYIQVRVEYPITLGDIQKELNSKSVNHQVNTDDFMIDADSGKVQSADKEIKYTELPSSASEAARNNLKGKGWKLNE